MTLVNCIPMLNLFSYLTFISPDTMFVYSAIILLVTTVVIDADYECLCNYSDQRAIYSAKKHKAIILDTCTNLTVKLPIRTQRPVGKLYNTKNRYSSISL